MTAQQLKNSILQLAVQGKLVPQDKNDEPASVLLEKIKAEKEKLIKEKKIKKEKPLAPITDEEKPFDIPDSWEWCRLGSLLSVQGGKRVPKGAQLLDIPTKHIYIRVTDMKDGTIIDDKLKYIDENIFQQIKKYIINKDDLYLTIAGTIGNVGVVPDKFDGMNLTENAVKLTNILINRLFVNCFINSNLVQNQFVDKTNTVAQPKLAIERILTTIIPLPPLAEQKRIVEKIEELLPHIEEYDKAEQKLAKLNKEFPDQLKKSILQYAVEGKLVPQDKNDEPASVLLEKLKAEKEKLIKEKKIKREKPLAPVTDDEKPFDIPESWEWCRLYDLCLYIQRGKSPVYSEIAKYPVIAQKCNQWSGFSIEKAKFIAPDSINKYSEERILKDNDLMWNSTGLGTLGRMAIYKSKLNPYELAVADSHVTVIRAFKQYINTDYLYCYFANPSVQSVIEEQSDGSTKQKELSTTTIKDYVIPLPPLAEQKRIVEKIEEVFKVCEGLKKP